MQGLAVANAIPQRRSLPRGGSNRSVRGGAVIADHFFACEGNVPLLTVERRVPVVAARGNVSGFVCWHIGEHSLPTSGFPFDNRSALWLLLARAVWAHSRILPRGSAAAHLGLSGRQVCPTRRPRGPHFRLPALGLAAILHVAISTPRHVSGFSNRSDRARRRQGPGLAPQLGHEHSGETSCDPGIFRCWQAPACSASSVQPSRRQRRRRR